MRQPRSGYRQPIYLRPGLRPLPKLEPRTACRDRRWGTALLAVAIVLAATVDNDGAATVGALVAAGFAGIAGFVLIARATDA